MAHNQAPAFIVVVALLFAAATPLAYGQLKALNISGTLCCTSTGTCTPGAVGIPGVAVSLNCTTLFGNVVTLAKGVTGPTGVFGLNVNNLLGGLGSLLTGILPCGAFVKLPLNNTICPILNTATGVVAGVPRVVNTVLNPSIGLVGNLTVPVFANVTVG